MEATISKFVTQLGEVQADDLKFEAKSAVCKVFQWKAHILRAQNQDDVKQQILSCLKEEVLIVVDWAMKFREKQSEWFAKRGISWHVSSVITRKGEVLEVTCYVHLHNNCRQDWYAVLSVLENVVKTIRCQNSEIKGALLRSDEAGCCHNSNLVSSFRHLGRRHKIDKYDHSEPQSGKYVCDRILCLLKASIRRYCNEGHDIVTAQDMCTALEERPVKETAATVCSIQEQFQTLQINNIPDYSSLHNFEFSEGGSRVWKAFGVRP